MAKFPTPKDPQIDFNSLLSMAHTFGIKFNEVERVIFRPNNIKVSKKRQWIIDEMERWGFKTQLELPFNRKTKIKL